MSVVVEDDEEVDDDGDERPLQHRGTVERLERRGHVRGAVPRRQPVRRRDLVRPRTNADYPQRSGTGAAAAGRRTSLEVARGERGARDHDLEAAAAARVGAASCLLLVDDQRRRRE